MNHKKCGRQGEESAAIYLVQHGFEIIARNLYIGHYEIDILARDASHLIFAEVKTRRAYPGIPDKFGRPSDAVNAHKRSCLLAAAREFLRCHPGEYSSLIPNIDVLEVYVDPAPATEYRVLAIRHFRNAVNGMKGCV